MICWGSALSEDLPRMLMGSKGGLNEWFLWQLVYNLNVLEDTKRKASTTGCCVTVMHVSLSSLTRSSRTAGKYRFSSRGQINSVKSVFDRHFGETESGSESVDVSQILITFWLWTLCAQAAWQSEKFFKYGLFLKTFLDHYASTVFS